MCSRTHQNMVLVEVGDRAKIELFRLGAVRRVVLSADSKY